MNTKYKVLIGVVVLVAVAWALLSLSKVMTIGTGYGISEEDNVVLAQCLTDKGVVMYGLPTCSHCKDQKALFGGGFELINYVDCSKNPDLCAGLSGVPAWKIGEKWYYGVQSLETLKLFSGC
ncbi:MAG: hypothetical protein AABX11_02145 [Nanoarchaeota archaeon]